VFAAGSLLMTKGDWRKSSMQPDAIPGTKYSNQSVDCGHHLFINHHQLYSVSETNTQNTDSKS